MIVFLLGVETMVEGKKLILNSSKKLQKSGIDISESEDNKSDSTLIYLAAERKCPGFLSAEYPFFSGCSLRVKRYAEYRHCISYTDR